jgi:hypothetical protein
MSQLCGAKTKTGDRCKAAAVENGLCAFHADPKRAAQLGRLGGQKNRRQRTGARHTRPPQTAKEIKEILAETMVGVQSGQLNPKIGSVIAYMGSALLKAIETTEMEERLQALERLNNLTRFETAVKSSNSP